MKKLINDPRNVVAEALVGIEAARPEVRVDHANRIVYRRDAPKAGKVGLVSGGGSGHEPLHGGFVGLGMLDAACSVTALQANEELIRLWDAPVSTAGLRWGI